MDSKLRESLDKAIAWERLHVSKIPLPHFDRTIEDKIADRITAFAGSMKFVYVHTVWFGIWVLINTGLLVGVGLGFAAFDPYPFGLLTMVVSLEAIFLSTFVMVAQNRQANVADARSLADYETNVRAEAEIAKLVLLVQTLVEHHLVLAESGATESPPTH